MGYIKKPWKLALEISELNKFNKRLNFSRNSSIRPASIWGDIWDKITPGFTVKSSFHLRNKEIRNVLYVRYVNAASTAMEVPATNHAIFKMWKARSPQMHLIFLSHFFMQLIWRILRLFWRRGVLKPSFSSRKAEIANSNTTGKQTATFCALRV